MNVSIKRAALLTFGCALLATGSLQAQGLGVRVTASLPEGDFGNGTFLSNQVGYGVGAHLAIGVPGGALVPRADYTVYKNAGNGNARANMLQAGIDYDFYFTRGDNVGPYLGVGAGYGSTKFQQDTPQFNDTPNNIFYGAQLGCMFNHHLGTELRYTYAEYKTHFSGSVPNWTAPTLNLSLILQF